MSMRSLLVSSLLFALLIPVAGCCGMRSQTCVDPPPKAPPPSQAQ